MDARAIEDLIYKQSGLLGVSGISSDMRVLLASDDERARFAVELFTYRVGRELGSLAAAAGGHRRARSSPRASASTRRRSASACAATRPGWAWSSIRVANQAGGPRISTAGSKVSAWVIPTNEEVMIARHTARLPDVRDRGD